MQTPWGFTSNFPKRLFTQFSNFYEVSQRIDAFPSEETSHRPYQLFTVSASPGAGVTLCVHHASG